MTITEALRRAQAELTGGDSPRFDSEILLCHVLGKSRLHLYTYPDAELTAGQSGDFFALTARRAEGWPVAYLTGRREFWSLPLKVSPATLIPRPETELLVSAALERLPERTPLRLLDLGTGTGAIALALASERPAAAVIAVDASAEALAVARQNATDLGLTRVDWRQGDWYSAVVDERFDAVVSNPPYIGEQEPEPSQGDCRFEPRQALVAPEAGLAALRAIVSGAPAYLLPGGWLLVEHGWRQGAAVRELFDQAGFRKLATLPDLQGHDRVTLGRI